jgi:S1-C subfamily serine protease
MKFIFKVFFVIVFLFLLTISSQLAGELYRLIRNDYVSSNVFFLSATPNNTESGGTGFVINYKNKQYTVTNWHVCRSTLSNVMYNAEEELKIIGSDFNNDLCLLTPSKDKTGLYLSFGKAIKHSEIHFIGFPNLDNKSIRYGNIISEKTAIMPMFLIENDIDLISCIIEQGNPTFTHLGFSCLKSFNYIDTSAAGGPGSSGGPTLNSFGLVLGVVQNFSTTSLNMGFIDKKYLEELLERTLNEQRND